MSNSETSSPPVALSSWLDTSVAVSLYNFFYYIFPPPVLEEVWLYSGLKTFYERFLPNIQHSIEEMSNFIFYPLSLFLLISFRGERFDKRIGHSDCPRLARLHP